MRTPSWSVMPSVMPSVVGLVVTLLGGCGGGAPAPKTAGPAAKRPPKTAIAFVTVYEGLLPVACFDAAKQAWGAGKACLELLPVEAEVRLEDQRVVKLTGHRTPTVTGCALETKLPMYDDAKADKPGAVAVWPATSPARFHRVSWDATKKGAQDLKPEHRDAVARAMAKLGPVQGVSLVQAASADLDDDGASELLVSATTTSYQPDKNTGGFAALFAQRGAEMALIRRSEQGVFRVEGTLDLDDDGLVEVLFSERASHPAPGGGLQRSDAFSLGRLDGAALATTRAVESCWPPLHKGE